MCWQFYATVLFARRAQFALPNPWAFTATSMWSRSRRRAKNESIRAML
ncbi:hypothetical protein PLANPX_0350 [Lacipirellula parvula]|uniref:Uncharacterized protein n=1 Tax=Lacipirellula parvula TaxID=2650471 RepID=A0A5K7X268_9BACT|nr:hypothetical protein PLANPX_0350 [Lacipirellula parvula]